jgi:hypothetical protein
MMTMVGRPTGLMMLAVARIRTTTGNSVEGFLRPRPDDAPDAVVARRPLVVLYRVAVFIYLVVRVFV